MREIKFRAWEKNLKEIIPVHNINFENKIINTESAWRFFDEVELMQYTSLKDKNGKEIFEGNIVELVMPDTPYVIQGNGYSDVDIEKGFKIIGAVTFLYSCWFIDEGEGKGGPLDFDENQQLEIIGNIYENPELLEKA